MWHGFYNIEDFRYSDYTPSLDKRSTELLEKCVNEKYKNFDVLVIKESVHSGNGSTHLLEVVENELMSLGYTALPVPEFRMDTLPDLNFSTISNYDYLLMDGFYIDAIEESIAEFNRLIVSYLNNRGKVIFTTGPEYSPDSFLRKYKEIVIQTCYPSYPVIYKIVHSHMKEFIEVFEHFGKTIYNNVETIRDIESWLMSINALAQLHNISNFNCIEFQFYQGNPIFKIK